MFTFVRTSTGFALNCTLTLSDAIQPLLFVTETEYTPELVMLMDCDVALLLQKKVLPAFPAFRT